MKGDRGPGKPYPETYVKVSYGISLLIYEGNAHGAASDRMCEAAALVISGTSDGSVRSGVSCDAVSVDIPPARSSFSGTYSYQEVSPRFRYIPVFVH